MINMDKIWSAACNGKIEVLSKYFNNGGEINKKYFKLGKNHSLIMGALRNCQYDTAKFLYNQGERIAVDEVSEIQEYYSDWLKTI